MSVDVAQQALTQARSGKRVLVVNRHRANDSVFNELASADDAIRVIRADYKRRVTFASGGVVMFASSDRNAGRGVSADVVYCGVPSLVEDCWPCVAASPGGVVIETGA